MTGRPEDPAGDAPGESQRADIPDGTPPPPAPRPPEAPPFAAAEVSQGDGAWADQSMAGPAIGRDVALPGEPGWAPDPDPAFLADERAAAERQARQQRSRTIVREVVETGLLALLVFLAVRASFQNFKVEGNSMQPTLEHGQFLIVNKLVYAEIDVDKLSNFIPILDAGDDPERFIFHGPDRGDIIVLRDPRKPDTDLIKRIVGLPGETIQIVDGQVFINGFRLEEPYITTPWRGNTPATIIPEDQYFVMGDNRSNSLDSRQFGLVEGDLIIGKSFVSYWPLEHFGLAPNGSPTVTDEPLAAFAAP